MFLPCFRGMWGLALVVCKLTTLKRELKKFNKDRFSDISSSLSETREARDFLKHVQTLLYSNLTFAPLQKLENESWRWFVEIIMAEESFLRQKSSV